MEFIFSMQMEKARHDVQSTQNKKLVIFLQGIKKKVFQLLLCSVVIENIQTFCRDPDMFVVTCNLKCKKVFITKIY